MLRNLLFSESGKETKASLLSYNTSQTINNTMYSMANSDLLFFNGWYYLQRRTVTGVLVWSVKINTDSSYISITVDKNEEYIYISHVKSSLSYITKINASTGMVVLCNNISGSNIHIQSIYMSDSDVLFAYFSSDTSANMCTIAKFNSSLVKTAEMTKYEYSSKVIRSYITYADSTYLYICGSDNASIASGIEKINHSTGVVSYFSKYSTSVVRYPVSHYNKKTGLMSLVMGGSGTTLYVGSKTADGVHNIRSLYNMTGFVFLDSRQYGCASDDLGFTYILAHSTLSTGDSYLIKLNIASSTISWAYSFNFTTTGNPAIANSISIDSFGNIFVQINDGQFITLPATFSGGTHYGITFTSRTLSILSLSATLATSRNYSTTSLLTSTNSSMFSTSSYSSQITLGTY